jgi:hypothetical protein
MAKVVKKTQPEILTGAAIDQAIISMASLVIDESPEVRAQMIGVVHDLINRGKQRNMAEWAADPGVGTERAALLSILMATKDNEEGLERLALLAARSIRHTGEADAAAITVASYIASPEGFDLFRTKGKNPLEAVPEEIRILFGGRMGESLRQLADLGMSVRTERLAALFGYAYSGLMAREVEGGIVDEDGAGLIERSQAAQYDIRIKKIGPANPDGSNKYEIIAEEGAGAMSENARSPHRPDVAFINDERKQIVIGLAFSGANADKQRDEINKYLGPLLHATQLAGSPWFGYSVAPFYVHAGTFVASDAEIRAGHKTSEYLIAKCVPDEQQRALATLELMAVPMHAVSPEQVGAFFKCNPLVGGTSTLEHLRHVEQTARLPFEVAMERHIAFLAKQAILAAQAAASIANAPETEVIVDNALKSLHAFMGAPDKAFGGMSKSTFDIHWKPMVKTIKSLADAVIKRHRITGKLPIDGLRLDKWSNIQDAAEGLLKIPHAEMQKKHRKKGAVRGSLTGVAESVTVIPLPKDPGPSSAKRIKR